MKSFLLKTIANAVALAVAVWLLADITVSGDTSGERTITLVLVALIFGVVNVVVKPVAKVLSFPVLVLTLGLFALVINALMLLLTSWLADKVDVGFHVEGFGTALLGGLIVSIVSWGMEMVLPDGK
ncbi:phage holin family protein [Streptomyces sp. P38-E01]|uniref:Phage holin family protein n=1 Tax=Streptomyces tardus TaxID=2780544 RepID=A0A949JP89_9ACTN|nr:phage holin family protein [Streptomyces tardus]MBU7597760.1 phage holin family protein [Streptomyces tardus]